MPVSTDMIDSASKSIRTSLVESIYYLFDLCK
jgi:hypothetical protein